MHTRIFLLAAFLPLILGGVIEPLTEIGLNVPNAKYCTSMRFCFRLDHDLPPTNFFRVVTPGTLTLFVTGGVTFYSIDENLMTTAGAQLSGVSY